MLNYVEFIEIETVELASGGDQPTSDSQTISRHEVVRQLASEQVQRINKKCHDEKRWKF